MHANAQRFQGKTRCLVVFMLSYKGDGRFAALQGRRAAALRGESMKLMQRACRERPAQSGRPKITDSCVIEEGLQLAVRGYVDGAWSHRWKQAPRGWMDSLGRVQMRQTPP